MHVYLTNLIKPPRDLSEKTPRIRIKNSSAQDLLFNNSLDTTNDMSGRTARAAKLKKELKRTERKKQRMNTSKDIMALTKGDVAAGDKAFSTYQRHRWWGSDADQARTKRSHRPNDERRKFYYRKYYQYCHSQGHMSNYEDR